VIMCKTDEMCAICGAEATHMCREAGILVCDSAICNDLNFAAYTKEPEKSDSPVTVECVDKGV